MPNPLRHIADSPDHTEALALAKEARDIAVEARERSIRTEQAVIGLSTDVKRIGNKQDDLRTVFDGVKSEILGAIEGIKLAIKRKEEDDARQNADLRAHTEALNANSEALKKQGEQVAHVATVATEAGEKVKELSLRDASKIALAIVAFLTVLGTATTTIALAIASQIPAIVASKYPAPAAASYYLPASPQPPTPPPSR